MSRLRAAAPAAARHALLTLALALVVVPAVGLPAPATAQSAGASDSPLSRGLAALRTGGYDDAVRHLTRAAAGGAEADRIAAARALARARSMTGQYEAALRSLERSGRTVPAVELARTRGLVLRQLGRDDEARAAFEAAVEAGAGDAIPARLDLALLDLERGARAAAYGRLEGFIELYNDGRARTAPELAAVATAVRHLGRRDPALLHDAVRAYEEALAADPSSLEVRLAMAELFLRAYDGGEAQALLAEVLAENPRHAAALRAMARARRFEGSAESLELAERALEVDARSADGRTLLALLRLELGDDDAAVAEATRALETNPRHREALAVRAAARYLAGDESAYEADRRRALAIDSLYAGFYTTAAELAVRRGRYADAVRLAGEAVALDSTAWDGWSLLGMNQLRTGAVAAARASLERGFRGDPFNVWTKNTLDLMDRLDTFETVRTDRFELVMAPEEADLLGPYAGAIAEEAYTALSERYGYRPETPVRVEIYPRHADFSVRTTGLTGLGALGVAFGNVLAVISPAARDAGTFHWGSTLWHEVAHAVTLGSTRHRIPRWLTEGISVHEERRSRPGWGGGPGPDFLRAYREDRLLPVRDIDAGFVRPSWPGQLPVSYQHASLLVAVIEDAHGPDAVRRLMRAYADHRDTEAAFREALGETPEAVDRRLAAHVESEHAAGLAAVGSLEAAAGGGGPPGAAGTGGSADDRVRAARMDRGDFAAQLAAGRSLFDAGRRAEAEPFLERARSLWPEYAGQGSPYEPLAAIRRERGDLEGAATLLRRATLLNETALSANLELAEVLEALGDPAGAAGALERAVHIDPHGAEPHERLAELAVRLGRPALEVRERRALVALDPVDLPAALYRLAVAQRRAGALEDARRTVMRALEAAPGYADAQDLFLELSGGGG